MLRHALFFQALLTLACPAPAPDDLMPAHEHAHDHDAGNQDVTDAGAEAACPPYAHRADGGGCTSTITWSDQQSGPPARDHHMTFTVTTEHGGTLYVTGGIDEPARAARNDLWVAPLSATGDVGVWVRGPTPPLYQTGSALATVGARTYVFGGKTVSNGRIALTTEVQSLEVSHSGMPIAWRSERAMPAAHFHASGHGFEKWVYVIGGLNVASGQGTTAVLRAEVLEDGSLGEWTTASQLPEPRTHHASFIAGRKLFVVSGIDGSGFGFDPKDYRDGLVSTIDAQGNLGPWTRFAVPFSSVAGSATVVGRAVYIVGGLTELVPTAAVWRATLGPDEALGPFEPMAPLPVARGHVHQTPAWRQFLYSFGGNVGNHVAVNQVVRGEVQ
jgi:hypothetical protein